jgi:hypothetical protein
MAISPTSSGCRTSHLLAPRHRKPDGCWPEGVLGSSRIGRHAHWTGSLRDMTRPRPALLGDAALCYDRTVGDTSAPVWEGLTGTRVEAIAPRVPPLALST